HDTAGVVRQLASLLHQPPIGLARLLRSSVHCLREHRASVEMRANASGQIRAAQRTEIRAIAEEVGTELRLSKALPACGALGYRVVDAKPQEERLLAVAQVARSSAVALNDPLSVDGSRVVRPDRLPAPGLNHLDLSGDHHDNHPPPESILSGEVDDEGSARV